MKKNTTHHGTQPECMGNQSNEPLYIQYGLFLRETLQLNFGNSIRYGVPAWNLIIERFPATLLPGIVTLILSLVIAFPLGLIARLHHRSWFGQGISLLIGIAQAIPNFWPGVILISLFAVNLRWLPSYHSLRQPQLNWTARPVNHKFRKWHKLCTMKPGLFNLRLILLYSIQLIP